VNKIEKRIVVIFTSGGDAPGMNPALRAAVRCWLAQGSEYDVMAARNGFTGLVKNDLVNLNHEDVAGLLPRGGTVIGAGRCENLKIPKSIERKRVKDTLKRLEKKLAGVIVIGGEGSFQGMQSVLQDECQVRAVGIPATIDNDIWDTDFSLGVDTALNTAVEIIDKIRDTAAAFRRAFVVEIMGRDCGYLSLATAIATESEAFFLPEDEPGFGSLGRMQKNLNDLYNHNALDSVVIVSEGSKLKLSTIQNIFRTYTKWDVRSVIPGYAQRGGSPSALDRILGSRFAWKAAAELKDKGQNSQAKIVTLKGTKVELTDRVDEVIKKSGKDARMKDLRFRKLIKLQRALSTYHDPLPYNDNVGNSLLIIHGPDAPGINAAIRAYTRVAMIGPKHSSFTGFRTFAVRRGFEGLADKKFNMRDFVELDWQKTTGFSYSGGVPVHLAQRRNIEPIHTSSKNWLGGSPISKGVVNDIEGNIEKFQEQMKGRGNSCKITNLAIIGGRDAIQCIEDIKKAGFSLPIIFIPASIDNDIPLTDFSIGFDTAQNNAVKEIDKIKETAVAEGRVFIIETMGGLSGCLPLSIGLATGAEHIFIPEFFKHPPTLRDMEEIGETIGGRFKQENSFPRKTHAILIFHESIIKQLGGIDAVTNFFTQKGARSTPFFEVRPTVLGYAQRGGSPSAFDRILATCLGVEAAYSLRDIVGKGGGGFAVVMKENDITRIEIEKFLTRAKTEVQDKEERMKELANIHCMLAKDEWLKRRLMDILMFSDKIVPYERNKEFIDLWGEFWRGRREKGDRRKIVKS
jgi:6-phosphofructokinase 1